VGTAGATHAKWVKDDVALLRAENRIELLKQNATAYDTVVGNGGQPGRSAWVNIYPQEQSKAGFERFACHRQVRAITRQFRSLYRGTFQSASPDGCTVYHHSMRFESPRQAQKARDRIV
jgi:hypothetical protein